MTTTGLITAPSEFGQPETVARLEEAIHAAGMTVYARIDHGAAAAAVNLDLGPTDLLIFGNARGGTKLMQAHQAVGIDLPLKVLVFQGASGQVFLTYNDPQWIAERHALGTDTAPTVTAMANALKTIAAYATQSRITG